MSEMLEMFNSLDEASERFRVGVEDENDNVIVVSDYDYDSHAECLYQDDRTYGEEGSHIVVEATYFFIKLKENPKLRNALIQLLEQSDTLEQ